jgi:hypothetical protein
MIEKSDYPRRQDETGMMAEDTSTHFQFKEHSRRRVEILDIPQRLPPSLVSTVCFLKFSVVDVSV